MNIELKGNSDLVLNDEKTLSEYGIFSEDNESQDRDTIMLNVNYFPIIIHINLSHTL